VFFKLIEVIPMRYAIGSIIIGFLLGASLCNLANAADRVDFTDWSTGAIVEYQTTRDAYHSSVIHLLDALEEAGLDPDESIAIAELVDTSSELLSALNSIQTKNNVFTFVADTYKCFPRE
jgi:hypothetical protein